MKPNTLNAPWLYCLAVGLTVFVGFRGYAEESQVWIVNLSSENGRFVAGVDAGLVQPGSAPAMTARAGGRTFPADVLDGRLWVAVSLKPMATLGVTAKSVEQSSGQERMRIKIAPDGTISVWAGKGRYEFGPAGLTGVTTGKRLLKIAPPLLEKAHTAVAYHGEAVTVLETVATAKKVARWEIYRDGTVRLTAFDSYALTFPGQDIQGYRYGSVERTTGFAVTRIPTPLGEPFYASPKDRVDFAHVLEWGALMATNSSVGLYCKAALGSAVVLLPRGAIRTRDREPTTPQERAQAVTRQVSALQLNGSAQKPAQCRLAAIGGLEEAKSRNAADSGIVALRQKEPGVFAGAVGGLDLLVRDDNGNGMPDTDGDRWIFSRQGKETLGYQFIPRVADPRREGHAAHVALDVNKNGRLDQEEWARPVWRFVDWNGDRSFFRGSLVVGGRLEQDAVYHRASGSPDGKLWDEQMYGLDMDGDGSQNITVYKTLYNFNETGAGDVETADKPGGVQFNFGRGDFSMVVLVDAGKGTVALGAIDYDTGEFFSRSGDTSRAIGNRGDDGIWRLHEEHQEYEGFAPGDAAGHLWNFGGVMGRLMFCGIGENGNWNLGFDPRIDLKQFDAKVITYRDPWGHSFSFASALKPLKWNGKILRYKAMKKGHLDYVDQAPWIRAVDWPGPSTMAVCGEKSFGTTSCEAYLTAGGADGHTESVSGKFPKALYYSPLLGGLHALGAVSGDGCLGVSYFDEDGDGLIDHYLYRVNKPGEPPHYRELTYEPSTGKVTLRDRERAVSWVQRFEFEPVPFYLENYLKIDAAYRKGFGQLPVVRTAAINAQGRLTGYELPAGTKAQPEKVRFTRLLTDAYHAGQPILDAGDFSGLSTLEPTLARRQYQAADLTGPFSKETLAGADVLLLQDFAMMPREPELAALKQWITDGGTLCLAVSQPQPDQQIAANAVLAALGVKSRFGQEKVSREFRCVRIPDNGNGDRDIAEERVPSPLNQARYFQDPTGRLLKDCIYINFTGYPLIGPAEVLLGYDNKMLLGTDQLGQGRVILSAFPVLANAYLRHPIHTYLRLSNDKLADNLLVWLNGIARQTER